MRVQGDLARANPDLSVSDLTKKVADQWRTLPDAEKSQYTATAQREMEQWKAANAKWEEKHPGSQRLSTSIKQVTEQLKQQNQEKKKTAAPKTPRKPRANTAAGAEGKKGRKPKAAAAKAAAANADQK